MTSTRTTPYRRRVLLASGTAVLLAATAACSSVDGGSGGSGGSTDEGLLSGLQDAGSITVGFAGEDPYSYQDESGELTGAAVALNEAVYAELGIDTVEGTLTEWNALIPGLNADRFDSISAGMSILPERCEQAAFGEPEIMYTTAFLVPEGNPKNLSDWQSAVDAGVNLAVMSGAIEAGYAEKTDVRTTQVGSPQDGLDAVVSGRADAFALTGISLRALAESADAPVEATESFVAVIDGVPQIGAGATVFRQGDTDLLDAYNEQLAEIVSDPQKYEDILGPFGFTEAERPVEGLTAEMLCEGDLEKIADELGPELGLDS
ncbi:ectoine/hydroxyectoine ABC transporter substrate-binding protein EhuB [Cellulosimicrobium cellulans]|uniref:ectoine/hydroxyectoine ABC transporter substrate-binding protein EhuB n=1 Tax=Cellulosimicrobium cellulans TaxID=1710 RepID=UPI001EDC32E8|nr:ectoine/hydroxyectoine ABC transporter substrate-binding protein EhuB [Cellulosimicrobium cellulans]UKJ62357.1 ectoine/hydroxyectoine ABC transporter substrate-binding protein EhuB [Cellulosimicrobium cellulans]